MVKRVGILGIVHESNTFSTQPTTLANFEQSGLYRGEALRTAYSNHETTGFIRVLEKHDIQPVLLMLARTSPSGTITKDAFDALLGLMNQELDNAGHLDGLLLAPHGAGVSEEYPDMDGHWMSLVRKRFPRPFPIIATCDPHANITPLMVDSVDALIAYRTNPHLDQLQRGLEAGELMAQTLTGKVRPTMAAACPPVVINIERQHTDSEPCRSLYRLADEQLKQPGVLSNSVILGFPYADVKEMGSGFVVVTDNDRPLAQKLADDMARWLIENRSRFVGQMISIADCVAQSLTSPGPVCLLDMGDNMGGGAPADGTLIAHEIVRQVSLLPQEKRPRSFVCLYDPQAQALAREAGVNAKLTLSIGGKTDDRHGEPLNCRVTVRQLNDGQFSDPRPRHGGHTHYNMGPTAIVETDTRLTVMITSRRTPPSSIVQLTAFGLDPKSFQVLVAKGVHAPVGGYGPFCPRLIRVNTPGTTCADLAGFDYKNRRRPLFPFEEIA
jgi:microcystin degradation protein MlrC